MRPPKSVRARLREAGQWSTPSPAPPAFSLIDEFSVGQSEPQPIPGAYQPVFSFSRDFEVRNVEFTLNPDIFTRLFDVVETSVHSDNFLDDKLRACGITANGFVSRLFATACLALANHLARIRNLSGSDLEGVSMFMPLELPVCVSDFIRSVGEFTGSDGKRWYLHDFTATVKSLVRAADAISTGDDYRVHLARLWLPTSPDDGNTSFVVAFKLHEWFLRKGFHVSVEEMVSHVFKGSIPACVSVHFSELEAAASNFIARLFKAYSTERQFIGLFSDEIGVLALSELGLSLGQSEPDDLNFRMSVCKTASRVHTLWSQSQRRYARLFGVVFSRSTQLRSRGGSELIASRMKGVDPEYEVKSYYCLPEEDLAVLACYGAPILFDHPTRFTRVGFLPSVETLSTVVGQDLGLG